MTPNPTTATRSQAMRHSVGAPALPYRTADTGVSSGRWRQQGAEGVVTVQGCGRERKEAVPGGGAGRERRGLLRAKAAEGSGRR